MPNPRLIHSLVIGEALIDIVHSQDGEVTEHIGGSPLNVAVGLSRLEHHVTLATHLGDDERGQRIIDMLHDEGVELTSASVNLERTSTATAQLRDDGSASYEFDLAWPPVTNLPGAPGHIHFGSIGAFLEPGAESVLAALRDNFEETTTSFDPNVRPSLIGAPADERARVEAYLPYVDVAKASDEDVAWLYPDLDVEDVAERWASFGPSVVAITRGGAGAFVVVGDDGGEIDTASRKVSVVDTVGAGDSFMAGLLSGLMDAGLVGSSEARRRLKLAGVDDIRPAIDRAVLTSSITVTRAGSQPPTREELRNLTCPGAPEAISGPRKGSHPIA